MSFWGKLFRKEHSNQAAPSKPASSNAALSTEAALSTGTAKQVIPTLESLHSLLASLEVELRSSRKLPVGRLRVKRELGSNVIAWSGHAPKTAEAEEFLGPRLATIGIRLLGRAAHTQDDDGSALMFWRFRNAPPALPSQTETEIRRLLTLPAPAAAAEAKMLAQEENFELLVAWLLEHRFFGPGTGPYNVLRESGSPKAAEILITLLDNPDPDIRERAAAILGPLGGERAASVLCSILHNAADDELRAIANALERLAWKGAVDPLMNALEGANERHAMTSLVGALRKCGAEDYSVFQVLIRGLSRGDAMAFECVAALFDLKTPCATAEVKLLLHLTKNQDVMRVARMYLQTHKAL
jgi:HEAT repeat protein